MTTRKSVLALFGTVLLGCAASSSPPTTQTNRESPAPAAPTPAAERAAYNAPISLRLRRPVRVGPVGAPAKYEIVLAEITDSRCPPGVTCAWAGQLAARLRLTKLSPPAIPAGTTHQEFLLGAESDREADSLGALVRLLTIGESVVTVSLVEMAPGGVAGEAPGSPPAVKQ